MRKNMTMALKGLGAVTFALALAACGSGLSSGSAGSAGGTPSQPTGSQTGTSLVELGNGVGTGFTQGTLALQATNLSAGGSTTVTATLVDANNGNALYTSSVTVTFTSNCVASGTATITQSVITTSGTAIASYSAQGCSGSDTITASAPVGSSTLKATAQLTVQPPTLGTIVFISATPSAISLQGVGGVSTSKVIFQVNDVNGNPVPNETVNFTLSTTAGGVSISPATAITGSNGQAATFVLAGTVHTSVNVTATVANTSLQQTTPNAIAISTGIPVQTRFSLSLQSHNLDAYDHDSVTDSVDVFAVDRYGNPATPGTNILFTTNGGGVISGTCPGSTAVTTACGSCQTDATGHCSVTWTSEGNRPQTDALDVIGHSHILAYTVGEENFEDSNADAVFDTSDGFTQFPTIVANTAQGDTFFEATSTSGIAPAYDDIGDPYMDSKEVGYFITDETFVDIDSTVTTRRAPSGAWFGAACGGFGTTTALVSATNGPGGAAITVPCSNKLTMIGKDDCIVMSTDNAVWTGGTPSTLDHTALVPIVFTLQDLHGNVVASDSKITVVTNNLSGLSLILSPASGGSTSSFTEPDNGCGPPGGPTQVTTFIVTGQIVPGSTTFAGSFHLQYVSSNGKASASSGTVTIQ